LAPSRALASAISGFERSQLLLLPEAVDDYVGPDNPVRFIDAFVDGAGSYGHGMAQTQDGRIEIGKRSSQNCRIGMPMPDRDLTALEGWDTRFPIA
jgi:hypothetical protein